MAFFLEIGGRQNPASDRLKSTSFEYSALDLVQTGKDVIVADITHCPQIPSNSFDVVFSVDVFEHMNRPWRAASEIQRILGSRLITNSTRSRRDTRRRGSFGPVCRSVLQCAESP